LVSSGRNWGLHFWDVARGVEVELWPPVFKTAANNVSAIAFSPDGRMVALAYNHAAAVWDAASGRELRRLAVHGAYLVAYSPSGELLATAAGAGIHLWQASSGKLLLEWHTSLWQKRLQNVVHLAFGMDSRTLAVAFADYGVELWKLEVNARREAQ
jgi:WD40 repeat protein